MLPCASAYPIPEAPSVVAKIRAAIAADTQTSLGSLRSCNTTRAAKEMLRIPRSSATWLAIPDEEKIAGKSDWEGQRICPPAIEEKCPIRWEERES